MRSAWLAALGSLALLVAAAPTLAQSDDPYAACAATADDGARLVCFDETYARERQGWVERREEARERSADEFGLSTTQVREREARSAQSETVVAAVVGEEGDVESLSSQVADVFTDARGGSVVLLANGQLWSSIPGSTYRGTIRPEWRVTVTKSWSGGYRMRFEGKTGFLSVKRLR
jgi:hypothetical protein